MWTVIDESTDTRAAEVPGIGVIVGVPGMGLTLVPGARILKNQVVRDLRTDPPLVNGVKASDIVVRPDPGAQVYYTQDDPDY